MSLFNRIVLLSFNIFFITSIKVLIVRYFGDKIYIDLESPNHQVVNHYTADDFVNTPSVQCMYFHSSKKYFNFSKVLKKAGIELRIF